VTIEDVMAVTQLSMAWQGLEQPAGDQDNTSGSTGQRGPRLYSGAESAWSQRA